MQIIPLQWQMLQEVNCNNVLGKLLQKIHGYKSYKNACANKVSKVFLLY
jgi:hypothetical protein